MGRHSPMRVFSQGVVLARRSSSSHSFEERAGVGGALFLYSTNWLQPSVQGILILASSGTDTSKAQSTD